MNNLNYSDHPLKRSVHQYCEDTANFEDNLPEERKLVPPEVAKVFKELNDEVMDWSQGLEKAQIQADRTRMLL